MHHQGSCQCGAVRFSVEGALGRPNACHCRECRKHSGHYGVSVDLPRDRLTIATSGELRWYQSSEKVRRGFCGTCGSSLFWDPIFQDWIAIAMGAFDTPTQTRLALHIYVSEKGDYYDIADGLPQNPK